MPCLAVQILKLKIEFFVKDYYVVKRLFDFRTFLILSTEIYTFIWINGAIFCSYTQFNFTVFKWSCTPNWLNIKRYKKTRSIYTNKTKHFVEIFKNDINIIHNMMKGVELTEKLFSEFQSLKFVNIIKASLYHSSSEISSI